MSGRATVRVLAFAALNLGTLIAFGNLGSCSAGLGNTPAFGFDGGATPVEDASFDGGASGGSSSGGGSGSSSGSSSGGSDAGAAPVEPTSLLVVHASANLYDFRVCLGVGGAVLPFPAYPDNPAHPMPETNYPGVPVGGAALLPSLYLSSGLVTPYLVRAQTLEKLGDISTNPNEPTCDQLICAAATCLTVDSDYVALPAVTFPSLGGTLVLAIQGCLAQGVASGSAAQCGSTYSAATGNLAAVAGTLTGADDAGTWSMELAQLSPSFAPVAGAAALTYVDPALDASVALTAPPLPVGAPVTVPLGASGVTTAYFVVGGAFAQSLASVQYFQAPASDPFTYFSAPTAYFVAVVGDATDAAAPASFPDGAVNPAFDGHGLHVIAYPEQ